MSNVLRKIPTVSDLLDSPPLKSLVNTVSQNVIVSRARQLLDDVRTQMQSAAANVHVPTPSELAQRIADWIATNEQSSIVPVINATGVIVHDRLGRVPLADEAIAAMAAVCRDYASVEIDLATGEPGDRMREVEGLMTRLVGGEAVTVVNNHAAATIVSVAALAHDREVLVSRGQLFDIDGCRLPEIIACSGARLREVGTTNKTGIEDYAAAISSQTAALLRVQTNNCEVIGCVEQTPLAELVALGRENNLPVIDSVSSGALVDVSRYGISGEPLMADSIRNGADLVLFSGDKLLGGPQCGLIVGRRSLVRKIDRHPRMRAVRAGQLTLAALAATLRLYKDLDLAERSIPVLSLLSTSIENLRQRAERLAPQIAATKAATVEIIAGQADVCGHRLARQSLPTIRLALAPTARTAEQLAAALRTGAPSVIGSLQDGKLLIDFRSVRPRDDLGLVAAFEALAPANSASSSTSASG